MLGVFDRGDLQRELAGLPGELFEGKFLCVGGRSRRSEGVAGGKAGGGVGAAQH
jgi:hypothetical protein